MAKAKSSRVPAIWGNVPPRNAHFTGRSAIIAQMRESREQLARQVVHGLGGVGKTEIAVEYIYRFEADYDLVWWIPAENRESIRATFVSLSSALELSEIGGLDSVATRVVDELRSGRRSHRWLLVFDNANDPEVVGRFTPNALGHVIITSRNSNWRSPAACFEVDVFNREESVELLGKNWPRLGPIDACELAANLGDVPLALSRAAAFNRQSGMQAAGTYKGEFGKDVYEHLGVEAAWRPGLEGLAAKHPDAAQLFKLFAFFGPEPISGQMLLDARIGELTAQLSGILRNEAHLGRALTQIANGSWGRIDGPRRTIIINPLVARWLRADVGREESDEYIRMGRTILVATNPGPPEEVKNWPRHERLSPHIRALRLYLSSEPASQRLTLDQIRYLYAIGDYAASSELARLALSWWSNELGPDHELTLAAELQLSEALRRLGEHKHATVLTQKLTQRIPIALGEDHELNLAALTSCGADHRREGDLAKALKVDQDCLGRSRAALGGNHPRTMDAAHNLAADRRLLGDFAKAKELDESTLQNRREKRGDSSPETLASVNSLVFDHILLGDYAEAKRVLETSRTSAVQSRSAHLSLLQAAQIECVLKRKLGEHEKALVPAEANFAQTRSQLTNHHDQTLAAQMTLVNALRAARDFERAEMMAEQNLSAFIDRFKADHPYTLGCAVNLAIVRRRLGQHDMAMKLDESTLQSLRITLGQDHPYTIAAMVNMANNLAEASRSREAQALSADAAARSRARYGANHWYTLAAEANLALDQEAVGLCSDTAALRDRVKQQVRLQLGPEHPETANIERGRRAEIDIDLLML
ncbi:hypothetical protein Rhe02_91030 [Rhizocola hellebori]|uniref:NB-ARC domain-containing protein n=1 Tax=Rhizocola hellebori TaxID=1392758 RepID=A0A8J3VMB6_9ACTN|nr:FxSxx-COOH system tetratricopeptide repeat protein [Rhizocola hellebori]GIH11036.1 hypothetical protein Rhe02_91030 [Rhizocola hellebori]